MILVTGGAGYIGSHCALKLLKENQDIVVFDNLSTGNIKIINELSKRYNFKFVQGDLLNINDLEGLFATHDFEGVFHFASFSQVGESVVDPKKYYTNNVLGTLNLLDAMRMHKVEKFIFSSSAAVYGEPNYIPIDELHSKNPLNPYGKTKLIIENILDDYDKAYGLKSVILRYFNVVGASSDINIGEYHEPETHLVPNILKSTLFSNKKFELYGQDYDTKDGTCVRDYINIEDLADAHFLAYNYLQKYNLSNCFNLGTREGYTVKDVFSACEEVLQKPIILDIKGRRDGDAAKLVADNTKAKDILDWSPTRTLKYSIQTAYNWELFLQDV